MTIGNLLDKISAERREFGAQVTSRGFHTAAFQLRAGYRHNPGEPGLDPTRFGDWEYNGRCTDFS